MKEASNALKHIGHDANLRFGTLTPEQLNWKPALGSWSVAQCFDHLIITQTYYFPLLDRLTGGAYAPTAWERFSPFSGLFGRMLIRALDPDNTRKTKTVARSEPSQSDLDRDIIQRFAEHQDELVARVEKLPVGLRLGKVIVTSPLSKLVTYSLDDCLAILVVHGQRHFRQAERVTTTAGFPVLGE